MRRDGNVCRPDRLVRPASNLQQQSLPQNPSDEVTQQNYETTKEIDSQDGNSGETNKFQWKTKKLN